MTIPFRAAVLAFVILPAAAIAQAPAPEAPPLDPGSAVIVPPGAAFITVREPGSWRVSDLRGRKVFGAEGGDIGEIKDVLVNRNGEVTAVLVGVGGFLGIGVKDVAVSMKALEFGPPVRPAPSTTGATGVPGAPAPGMAAPGTTIRDDGLPDRIVLRVTKPQLEQAPRFEDGRVAVQSVEGTPPPADPAAPPPPAPAPKP
jgi:hypothetical protein